MSKLYFSNKGYFDIRAMMTFGVSAKESLDAIGFFGTGFKYAVAIILRLGGSIKITTMGEVYEFTVKNEEIRGKEFKIVYMNDREAGFTTHLGTNWKPWMAFRELYCNCMDESGVCGNEPEEMDTVIEVECSEVYDAFINKDDYFISGDPLASVYGLDIHQSPKPFIFYKGVAVRGLDNEAVYSYNVTSSIELTEDRTAKYDFQLSGAISGGIQRLENKVMLKKILSAKHGMFESRIGYSSDITHSDAFVELARELLSAGIAINDSAREMLKNIDVKSGNWPKIELSKVQKSMLDKSMNFLRNIGINIDKFPIHTVDGLGDGVMGRALDGVIYLSHIPFDQGTKQVASTLIEEWVHNEYGCEDFDRQMQSWLFDKILSIGEELNGEPL